MNQPKPPVLQPGDMILPPPVGIGVPGIVVVNAVYDLLPLSEVTGEFNKLRNYEELHQLTNAGEGIKVGVADTGVDKSHLMDNLKGCVAKDFTRSRTGFYDYVGHGSHTTGMIGSRGSFLGLAPKCDLYHAKVLDDRGSGGSDGIAAGIDWLVEQGCQLINLSLGGSFSQEIEDACRNAATNNVIIFASMGNSGMQGGGHPGTSRYTFGVTAVDYDKKVAGFSSRDPMAKYTGYGVQVLSLVTNGKLGKMSGTSMSCPDQVGIAANILSYMRKLQLPLPSTMEDYEALVQNSVIDLGSPGSDTTYGLGFIDLWKVLRELESIAQPPTPPIVPPPVNPEPTPVPSGKINSGIVSTDDGVLLFSNAGHQASITIKDKTYSGRASFLTPTTTHTNCKHKQ